MVKKMISLKITDELREALRVEAFKRSVSISEVIRQLLIEGITLAKSNNQE